MRASHAALLSAAVMALVGAGSVVALSATPAAPATTVTCSRTATVLTCPLPAAKTTTVTMTRTATVTKTVPGPTVTQTVSAAPSPSVLPPSPDPTSTNPTPASAFPDASTTGVPTGTPLSTVNGDLTSSAPRQTINGKLITGDFIAGDPNVTLKNSVVLGRIINQSNGLTVIDSTIGPDSCPPGPSDFNELGGSNYTLTRVHVRGGGADLIGIGGDGTISVVDSLIDHACFYNGEHLDAAQFYSPGDEGHVTFTHDTIDIRPVNDTAENGNAAIFWADNPAPASTLTVTGSLLAGGNYTVALYDAGTITITGNTFVKGSYTYGPCATNTPLTFTGNIYDNGSPVPPC